MALLDSTCLDHTRYRGLLRRSQGHGIADRKLLEVKLGDWYSATIWRMHHNPGWKIAHLTSPTRRPSLYSEILGIQHLGIFATVLVAGFFSFTVDPISAR
jgi:hypothetical protein